MGDAKGGGHGIRVMRGTEGWAYVRAEDVGAGDSPRGQRMIALMESTCSLMMAVLGRAPGGEGTLGPAARQDRAHRGLRWLSHLGKIAPRMPSPRGRGVPAGGSVPGPIRRDGRPLVSSAAAGGSGLYREGRPLWGVRTSPRRGGNPPGPRGGKGSRFDRGCSGRGGGSGGWDLRSRPPVPVVSGGLAQG